MNEMLKRELAFFGKITAGVTHEMKNVLAVINESTGLMEDLMAMASEEPFPFRDRFLRSTASIQAQVERGVALSGRLNRFAHSIDNPVALVDLGVAVDHLVLLAQRFAKMKRVELTVTPAGGEYPAETSPILLNLVLYNACEFCWNRMPEGGNISLHAGEAEGEITVAISCNGVDGPLKNILPEDPAALPEWAALAEAVESLPGKISCDPSQAALCLSLPRAAG